MSIAWLEPGNRMPDNAKLWLVVAWLMDNRGMNRIRAFALLGTLAMALIARWFMEHRSTVKELQIGDGMRYRGQGFTAGNLAPLGSLLVLTRGWG